MERHLCSFRHKAERATNRTNWDQLSPKLGGPHISRFLHFLSHKMIAVADLYKKLAARFSHRKPRFLVKIYITREQRKNQHRADWLKIAFRSQLAHKRKRLSQSHRLLPSRLTLHGYPVCHQHPADAEFGY